MTAGLVLLIVVGAFTVVLVAQNVDAVDFELLWWDIEAPLAVLLLAIAVLTLVIDQIVGAVWRRRRRQVKELRARQSS